MAAIGKVWSAKRKGKRSEPGKREMEDWRLLYIRVSRQLPGRKGRRYSLSSLVAALAGHRTGRMFTASFLLLLLSLSKAVSCPNA